MWYFAWILGTCLACSFAILNAIWLELKEHQSNNPLAGDSQNKPLTPAP